MRSIIEYIDKYGEYDFSSKDFSDVDGLILSQFSYLKMDKMVPKVGCDDYIYLKDIIKHEDYEELYADERYEKNNRELYEKMAASRRFGDIRLGSYINLVSKRFEMQFCAVTCDLPGGKVFVAYRGTDESIIGWKEDFNMAYTTPVPAQIKALDYLNYVSERIKGNFIVGGHSKGGNLAVYAAMKISPAVSDRIDRIYSYDGPGFTKKILSESDFARIEDRVLKFVPHSSIVGMLLQNQEKYVVVEAKHLGLLQHDPYNWVVENDDFVRLDDVSEVMMLQNQSVNEWAQETDAEAMRIFVDQLYDIIESTGVEDLNDFKGNFADFIYKFTIGIEKLDEEQKALMKKVLKSLVNSFIETVKNQSSK